MKLRSHHPEYVDSSVGRRYIAIISSTIEMTAIDVSGAATTGEVMVMPRAFDAMRLVMEVSRPQGRGA